MSRPLSIIASIIAVLATLNNNIVLAQRTWYFSSTQGNDNNSGAHPDSALRSVVKLQQLLSGGTIGGRRLQRGDTIALRRGDTFRVWRVEGGVLRSYLSLSGSVFRSSGPPIVITAYGNSGDPLPIITGTFRLADSARAIIQSGQIVKIYRPLGMVDTLVALRVFYKGRPLRLARFPNDTMLIVSGIQAANSGDNDTLLTAALGTIPPGFLAGAVIWSAVGADYSWGCNRVVGNSGNELYTLRWGVYTPRRGARFYLEGKLEFLDMPGEWYYDEISDTLYIWPDTWPFNPADYEVMPVAVSPSNRNWQVHGRGIVMGTSYDTMPNDPVNGVIVENLHFFGLIEGVRTAGVKNINIRNNAFSHCLHGIWNFLADSMFIRDNVLKDLEFRPITVYGRMPAGMEGNPRARTRQVYVERNVIKRTGLAPRWTNRTLSVDSSAAFVEEDYSIVIGYNIENIMVRYNIIDSVSQGGISGNLFPKDSLSWYNAYPPGVIPFIVEKNFITNFCMDFSDCGGIKLASFLGNGIIRNNILIKGHNRSKDHLSYIRRPYATALYADVGPQDAIFENNTVVGSSFCCHIFYGEGPIKNIVTRGNTFYFCDMIGVDAAVSGSYGAEGLKVEDNLFFGGANPGGSISMHDESNNGKRDTFETIKDNIYALPTYAPAYKFVETATSFRGVYGFRRLQTETSYENSPLSRWVEWVRFHYWDSAVVLNSFVSNPSLSSGAGLPISPFGKVQIKLDTASPWGGPAYLIYYPDTAQGGVLSGFKLKTTEPLYNSVLDSTSLYRWSIIWIANKAKDFPASTSWKRYIHPNTGDTLADISYFALPVLNAYTPETLYIWYRPEYRQELKLLLTIELEKGDSIWLKYFNFEEIDTSSVPSMDEIYPIYVNPSDTMTYFQLPAGWVYLTLDSTVVWGSISVPPWQSRILVRLLYDSSLVAISPSQETPLNSWAIVYPNPVRERLTILVPHACSVTLLDIEGRILWSGNIKNKGEIDIRNFPSGIYLLKIFYYGEEYHETVKVEKK